MRYYIPVKSSVDSVSRNVWMTPTTEVIEFDPHQTVLTYSPKRKGRKIEIEMPEASYMEMRTLIRPYGRPGNFIKPYHYESIEMMAQAIVQYRVSDQNIGFNRQMKEEVLSVFLEVLAIQADRKARNPTYQSSSPSAIWKKFLDLAQQEFGLNHPLFQKISYMQQIKSDIPPYSSILDVIESLSTIAATDLDYVEEESLLSVGAEKMFLHPYAGQTEISHLGDPDVIGEALLEQLIERFRGSGVTLLSPRNLEILVEYGFGKLNRSKLAKRHGITTARVSEIVKTGLVALRAAFYSI